LDRGCFLSTQRRRKAPTPETDGSIQNQQQVGLSRPFPVFASLNPEVPPMNHVYFVGNLPVTSAATAAGFALDSHGRRPEARTVTSPWTAPAGQAAQAANGEKAGRTQLGY
jgi:hypothetical protein